MKIFVPADKDTSETRVSLMPADSERLIKLGAEIEAQAGLGQSVNINDKQYEAVGVKISKDNESSFSGAQIILRINSPDNQDIQNLSEGCIHISFLDPFNNHDVIKKFIKKKNFRFCQIWNKSLLRKK